MFIFAGGTSIESVEQVKVNNGGEEDEEGCWQLSTAFQI